MGRARSNKLETQQNIKLNELLSDWENTELEKIYHLQILYWIIKQLYQIDISNLQFQDYSIILKVIVIANKSGTLFQPKLFKTKKTSSQFKPERRHSSFFVRLSSICWAINDNVIWELVENLMSQNRHKLLYYKRELTGMNTVVN